MLLTLTLCCWIFGASAMMMVIIERSQPALQLPHWPGEEIPLLLDENRSIVKGRRGPRSGATVGLTGQQGQCWTRAPPRTGKKGVTIGETHWLSPACSQTKYSGQAHQNSLPILCSVQACSHCRLWTLHCDPMRLNGLNPQIFRAPREYRPLCLTF